jgi:hypothetical protein
VASERTALAVHSEGCEKPNRKAIQLRNEAQLSCVSLHSRLDGEGLGELSRVKMNANCGRS